MKGVFTLGPEDWDVFDDVDYDSGEHADDQFEEEAWEHHWEYGENH